MRTTLLRAAAATAAAMMLTLGGVASAQATGDPLPLSDQSTLQFFDCDNGGLFGIDLSTLEVAVLDPTNSCGEGNGESAYVQTASFNPNDAHIYALTTYIGGGPSRNKLLSVDLQGRVQPGYPITFTGTSDTVNSIAIDPTTGEAFAFDSGNTAWSLDLATGDLSNARDIGINATIAAYSPDGTLYAYTARDEGLYIIDTEAWTATAQSNLMPLDIVNGYTIFGLAFDANGNLFISDNAYDANDPEGGGTVIYSVNPADGFATAQPFLAPAPGDYGHPWNGDANNPNYVTVSGFVLTYGNLAVNFDAQGGSAAQSARFYSSTVLTSVTPALENLPVTLPETTRDGYTFDGWFDAASGGTLVGQAGDEIVPDATDSYTLYAHWTAIPSAAALASTGANPGATLPVAGALFLAGLAGFAVARRVARR